MERVTIEEADVRLAEFVERVERVERVEQGEIIVVTRDGRPVLDMVPHKRKGGIDLEGGRRFKRERGIDKVFTYLASDFDDPLPEDFLITQEPDENAGPR